MSRFRANLARITAGSALSQAMLFAATPVLTRVCSAEQFGVFAIFSSLLAVASGLFTLKYDLAVLLPSDSKVAHDVTALTLLMSAAFSATLLLSLTASGVLLGVDVKWQYWLLPFGTWLAAAVTCCQQWSARAQDYRVFVQAQVIGALTNVATAIAVASYVPGFIAPLVCGFLAGQCASLALWIVVIRPRVVPLAIRRALAAAREFKRFPLYVLPTALLLTIGTSAQPWLVAKMFTLEDVGHYAVANRVLLAPSALVGGAIAEAFRVELVARLHRGEAVSKFAGRVTGATAGLALVAFGAAAFTAAPLFSFFLGDGFTAAGILARYLVVGAYAQFIVQPHYFTFIATGDVRLGLVLQLGAAVIPAACFVGGGMTGHLTLACLSYSLSALVMAVVIVLAARQALKRADLRAGSGSA